MMAEWQWQPIETAPKGELLLYFPKVEARFPLWPMIRVGSIANYPYRKPSHWMPLPEPPNG